MFLAVSFLLLGMVSGNPVKQVITFVFLKLLTQLAILDLHSLHYLQYITITYAIHHKNYNFLDCDWFKKTPVFH